MEAYLDVRCRCDDDELRAVIVSCLSVDGPVFEEDVAPVYVEVFHTLEYIDPPDDLIVTDDGVLNLSWMMKSVEFFEEACGLLLKLDKAGVEEITCRIQADDFTRKLVVVNHQVKAGK
ncbi:MAG: hypothetical protein KZQ78_12820 [Candidatus Thiodiazotropha sp. (ex Ustalcina ferruginea)]|nr:hypothetical protein [Candidatus Thiodiazotropha sp. (ex Ustalcina ferruginea)]